MLRPCRAAPPALMDEQPQSGALSTLLIVCCNACSRLRGKLVGDQGEKLELGWPQSHITDFAATLKAAEKRKAKKKLQCDRTQGKRHTLLSKTQGKCHESAECQWKWKVLPRKPRDASHPACWAGGALHSAGKRHTVPMTGGMCRANRKSRAGKMNTSLREKTTRGGKKMRKLLSKRD